jgi:hypothetical protein
VQFKSGNTEKGRANRESVSLDSVDNYEQWPSHYLTSFTSILGVLRFWGFGVLGGIGPVKGFKNLKS